MSRPAFRFLPLAAIACVALTGAHPPAAGAAIELAEAELVAILQAADELAELARAAAQPLPEGEVRVLTAVVMEVKGRAQWRADGAAEWAAAKIDDVLAPGTYLRTGLRSTLALRVGKNATVRIDRNSELQLPELVQDGAVLRTAVALERGRADIKVDRVGLTNDFSVVTPSTTLAVRGSGLGVQFGAFRGTEVFASPLNELFAIELRYFLTRFSFYLSGGGRSSDAHKNPVLAQLFQTFGPPPVVSALIEADANLEQLQDSIARSPVQEGRVVDNAAMATMGTLTDLEEMGGPTIIPGSSAEVAAFICEHLIMVFTEFDASLNEDFGGQALGGFTFPGLDQLFAGIDTFCVNADGQFIDSDLDFIIGQIAVYCAGQFQQQQDVETCVQDFVDAVVTVFDQGGSPALPPT